MKLGTFKSAALLVTGSLAAAAAVAQTGAPAAQGVPGLNVPQNPQFFGNDDANVRKATAIVNGVVITGTQVDHRLALMVSSAGGRIPPEEMERLRQQVLRNLVDETLKIQAAEAEDIKITNGEIDQYYARYAQNFSQTPQGFGAYLRSIGSSEASVRRLIHGEIAWGRLQAGKIEAFVNVSNDEVNSVIERLNASRGTQQFRVAEIFISATPETAAEARANAERIVEQLKQGAPFVTYARQFSEASTAAVGGDLGWVRAEQLPEALAAAVQQMPVGSVSNPIAIPGGYSILAVQDSRQVLTADPRDAILSLKQMTVSFAPGMSESQVQGRIQDLLRSTQTMGGCGGAETAAQQIGAEVIANDQVRVRDLPPALQQTLLQLGIGESTQPFGEVNERVSVLVLCGRDDPDPAGEVSFEQVYNQLAEARVNMRARRYLRDLRRDAVVDYR
ncbi:MAG: peptidylprolyl isomerase [Allosphingosinicella sp.]